MNDYRVAVELLLAIHTKRWPALAITPAETLSGVLEQIRFATLDNYNPDIDPVYKQAKSLMHTIHAKHWGSTTPITAPTTSGVLDQIDHLTASLVLAPSVPEDITRQMNGEPLPRATAISLVDQWVTEWMFADAPHWGDKISWQTAATIASKIDEANGSKP